MASPTYLMSLSSELLHGIFVLLDPEDLAALPRVCRDLHVFVRGNQTLCREIYLSILDKPEDMSLNWEQELHDLVRLRKVCANRNASDKMDELAFVSKTVDRLLKNASSSGETLPHSKTHLASRNAEHLKEIFKDDSNREAFMQRSFLFERVRHDRPLRLSAVPKEHHQQSAKLHCLYGKPILHIGRTRSHRTYPYARSSVYDLRMYTANTMWGPFMDDTSGRVDWEKMEAILIDLGRNMSSNNIISRIFTDVWDNPFSGAWRGSYKASPRYGLTPTLEMRDCYNVTGTWCQIVCFLDYNDFFNFNFPVNDALAADAPRPQLDVEEAARLIIVRISITDIQGPGPDDHQDWPVVHFRGVSQSLDDWDGDEDNNRVDGRGTVRMTKEGEVRWTTVSIFHGHERWRSECVQLGGVRSARGVFGNWFDRDYDHHGPAGPTAFWKVSDSENPREVIHDLLPNEVWMAHGTMGDIDESDVDEEYHFEGGDNEDEDDDDDSVAEEISSEIPGLLQDAQLEVTAVVGSPGPAEAGQGSQHII